MHVSVVIPAYNAEAHLTRAVTSALAQPEVRQVILAEDGSRDGTLDLCRALVAQDTRIELHRHLDGGNHGAAAARNLGLAQAREDLVAFLDADDFYLAGRFGQVLARFSDPRVDGVYEGVRAEFESEAAGEFFMARRGHALVDRERRITAIRPGFAPEALFVGLVNGHAGFCHLNGLTLRRRLAQGVGGFLGPLRLHQDTHYLWKVAYCGRLVPGGAEPVAVRWVHPGNRITGATPEVSGPLFELLYRDLVDWAVRIDMKPEAFQALLKRYLQRYAWNTPHFGVDHPVNRALRALAYTAHVAHSPRRAMRIFGKLLRYAPGGR